MVLTDDRLVGKPDEANRLTGSSIITVTVGGYQKKKKLSENFFKTVVL